MKPNIETFKKFTLLVKQDWIESCDHHYYNLSTSLVDDEMYDQMKAILLKENPFYSKVGSKVDSSFEKVRHDYPMLSLDKLHSEKDPEEHEKSLLAMKKFIGTLHGVLVDFKIDGISLSLKYKNGVLVQAVTRGDGTIGEDVTENAKMIYDIPNTIQDTEDLEVRGEVYVKLSVLNEINEALIGDAKYKNARNYASGSLRQKDSSITKDRKLSFFAYSLLGTTVINSDNEKNRLQSYGFTIPYSEIPRLKSDTSIEYLQEVIHSFYSKRSQLDFLVDGLVFKEWSFENRETLGENDKYPKWAMAWKFLPVEKQTTLLGIDWQVGKTGRITPCAIIEPVDIDGSMVSHPSLHNRKQMEKLGIMLGASLTVCKSGDVIPYVSHSEGGDSPVIYPEVCPVCGSILVYEDVYIMCENPDCKEKLLGRIQVIVENLGIDEFGDATRRAVVEKGLVKNVFDIFKLSKADILSLDGFKEKSASKLIDNIQKAEKTPINLLSGLVIPGVGKTIFNKLLSMSTLEELIENMLNGYTEEYRELPGIGDFAIDAITEYGIHHFDNLNILLNFYKEFGTKTTTALKGLSFAITGALSRPRKEIESYIELNGGRVGGMSKTTDYLICNSTKMTSKMEKAAEYGTKIITEEKFFELWS